MEKQYLRCSKKIRIGIILNGATPGDIAGGDVHILNLITALSKKYDVCVIIPYHKEMIERINRNSKAEIIEMKDKYKFNKKEDLIKVYLYRAVKVYKILKKEKFDLVVTSCPFFCDVLPLLALDKKTKVACWIFHVLPKRKNPEVRDKILNLLTSLQEEICFRIIKRKADLIFTCNNIEKQKIFSRIRHSNIQIGYLGIDKEFIDKIKAKRKKDTAFFVGRMVRQKGIFDLVRIMKKITKKNRNFRLYMAGGGPEKQELEKEIKRKNLQNNVFVLGYVSDKELFKKMKESEFFFFPSYEEGFGIVVAEALYCGNKVICYKLPHYKEFFGDFPEYVEIGNIKEFVEKINIDKDLKKQEKFAKEFDHRLRIKKDLAEIENLTRELT